MTTNHLLVLSQPDFIDRQLGALLIEATPSEPRASRRRWLRLRP